MHGTDLAGLLQVASQFSDVWTGISSALDDSACVSNSGGATYFNEMDHQKLLQCTGEVVLSALVKVFAKLYASGDCSARMSVQCEACCLDSSGNPYYKGCTQEHCQSTCMRDVNQYALAHAKATIQLPVQKNTYECQLLASGVWDFTMSQYKNVRTGPV